MNEIRYYGLNPPYVPLGDALRTYYFANFAETALNYTAKEREGIYRSVECKPRCPLTVTLCKKCVNYYTAEDIMFGFVGAQQRTLGSWLANRAMTLGIADLAGLNSRNTSEYLHTAADLASLVRHWKRDHAAAHAGFDIGMEMFSIWGRGIPQFHILYKDFCWRIEHHGMGLLYPDQKNCPPCKEIYKGRTWPWLHKRPQEH